MHSPVGFTLIPENSLLDADVLVPGWCLMSRFFWLKVSRTSRSLYQTSARLFQFRLMQWAFCIQRASSWHMLLRISLKERRRSRIHENNMSFFVMELRGEVVPASDQDASWVPFVTGFFRHVPVKRNTQGGTEHVGEITYLNHLDNNSGSPRRGWKTLLSGVGRRYYLAESPTISWMAANGWMERAWIN